MKKRPAASDAGGAGSAMAPTAAATGAAASSNTRFSTFPAAKAQALPAGASRPPPAATPASSPSVSSSSLVSGLLRGAGVVPSPSVPPSLSPPVAPPGGGEFFWYAPDSTPAPAAFLWGAADFVFEFSQENSAAAAELLAVRAASGPPGFAGGVSHCFGVGLETVHAGIRAAADRYSDGGEWEEELGKHELGLAVLASCTAPGDGDGQLHCEKSVREMSVVLDKENFLVVPGISVEILGRVLSQLWDTGVWLGVALHGHYGIAADRILQERAWTGRSSRRCGDEEVDRKMDRC